MKVAIYTPYLDSFGGGERYTLTIAEVLSKDHQVDLLLDRHLLGLDPENLIKQLGERLGLDLSKVNLVEAPIGHGSFFDRLMFFKKYDMFVYLTDGSLFYSTAKKNLIHFQVPFENDAGKGLRGRVKLSSWDLAVCNSKFTEGYIKKYWPLKTTVLYPPVETEKFKPLKKEKYILSVGRFASFSKSKKHEEMIQAFWDLSPKIKGWSLHLAGSVDGDEGYIEDLKKLAGKNPVYFYPNTSFDDLIKLFGQSSIYWHASGFGEDDPKKMEHFGISTVEAMASGCVPVVIKKGGQPEIVEDGVSGFLWEGLEELETVTLKLIDDPKLLSEVSKKSVERSKIYSKKYFEENLNQIIQSL